MSQQRDAQTRCSETGQQRPCARRGVKRSSSHDTPTFVFSVSSLGMHDVVSAFHGAFAQPTPPKRSAVEQISAGPGTQEGMLFPNDHILSQTCIALGSDESRASPILLEESLGNHLIHFPDPSIPVGSSVEIPFPQLSNPSTPPSLCQTSSYGSSADERRVEGCAEIGAAVSVPHRRLSRDISSRAESEYDSEGGESYEEAGVIKAASPSLTEALAFSGDYGAGYTEQTAQSHGVDLRGIVRRIMLLLTSGNPASIMQAMGATSFGFPVNLLRRTAPHLRSHLHAMLASTTRCPPPEVALRMCSQFAFDGVHLTLCGFAAALVADRHNQLTASVPLGYVLTAPRHLVACSTDIHSNIRASTSTRDTDFDEDDGVWSSSVSLSTLYNRWPHLVRLFRNAKRAAVTGAEALLAADEAGVTEEVSIALSRLYAAFIQGANFSAACWVLRPEGVSQVVSHSPPFLRLMGINDASLRQYMQEDPDSSQGDPLLWLHPSNTARRAMASLAAANQGLETYTFEGLHMRRVGGQPHDNSLPTSTSYSPFYALQTVHIERFPNGAKRVDIVYFSDVVNVRKTVEVSQLHTALTEVDALEQVVGQADLPREVSTAMQHKPRSPDGLVSMLSQLDQDSRLRFVKRLCMVLQHESDPLLLQHIASGRSGAEGGGEGVPSAAQPGSMPVPMLSGITHERLQALKERLLCQLGPQTLHVVQAMLMHLVSQAPRQVLFVWEGREYETAFPYAALHKAAQRWAPAPVPAAVAGQPAAAAAGQA